MTTPITSFPQLQSYVDSVLSANGELPVGSPHRQFWDTLTYEQFVAGDVPNVKDPTTGGPMKILVIGDSRSSNFVKSLAGTPNSPFDPATGDIGQMPANGPPYFTPEQIAPIAAWIDAGCPK